MICQWDSLLALLPQWMRAQTDELERNTLTEARLRLDSFPELISNKGFRHLSRKITREDIAFCMNAASRYSPWAAETMAQGYITAPGGHRVGISGLAVYKNGELSTLRQVRSLCIRVARDFPGIARGAPTSGSVLILGAPGWGKTTLLRDLIRLRSETRTVAVVDERGELFPEGLAAGMRMDVLTGAAKAHGITWVLRTMGPEIIAVDEITAGEDCDALRQAVGCGVELLATAHAGSLEEFYSRPLYRSLADAGLFSHVLILNRDKTYRKERMRS